MPEKYPDYRDLPSKERHVVLHELEVVIIAVVATHPDAREDLVMEAIHSRHPYGYMAWLAIQHAVKNGDLVECICGNCTILRLPETPAA